MLYTLALLEAILNDDSSGFNGILSFEMNDSGTDVVNELVESGYNPPAHEIVCNMLYLITDGILAVGMSEEGVNRVMGAMGDGVQAAQTGPSSKRRDN